MIQTLCILFYCLVILHPLTSFGSVAESVHCPSLLSMGPPDGFSIQSEDIALDPVNRSAFFNGKVAKLSRSEYVIMELLILADGAVVPFEEFQDEAIREAKQYGKPEPEYSLNWLSQFTFRLRHKLKKTFASDMDKRIINFHGRGLAWMTPSLTEKSKSFDPDKLTYVSNKQRLFVGKKEIRLSPHLWSIFSSFVDQKKNTISTAELKDSWWLISREEMSKEALKVYVFKLNEIFRKELQSDSNHLLSSLRGEDKWIMDMTKIEVI